MELLERMRTERNKECAVVLLVSHLIPTGPSARRQEQRVIYKVLEI